MKTTFSPKLERLIDFVNFTHEFQQVVRVARIPHANRMENDAEHSYQLAMVAWFLIDQENLSLNKEFCFMYALAHDVVEIYAGDTFAFDKTAAESKHEREKKALQILKERFPHFSTMIKIIEQYEKREDDESVFVYALDKLLPPLQIYLEDGKLWHECNVSLEQILENKNNKIVLSPVVDNYWQELLKEFEKNKDVLFLKK